MVLFIRVIADQTNQLLLETLYDANINHLF